MGRCIVDLQAAFMTTRRKEAQLAATPPLPIRIAQQCNTIQTLNVGNLGIYVKQNFRNSPQLDLQQIPLEI